MNEPEAYVPPVRGSDRWNQARAERVEHTGQSDDDDPELDLLCPQMSRGDDFLYPGCITKYTAIPFVHNSCYNQCVAAIVSTDRDRMPFMISLSNGDSLPNDTIVSIIARRVGNIVCTVDDQYSLPINLYLMEKAGNNGVGSLLCYAELIDKIIKNNKSKLQNRLAAAQAAENIDESFGKESFDEEDDD